MALGAAVLASRALAAPTPAWALLAISATSYGQWCPSRVLLLREQVAPMSWGTALPEPGNVPACRTCQRLSWPVATVLQQWTCQGLGYTREGKDSSGRGVVKPNTMVGPWRGFSSARAMVQLSHGITCQAHTPGWGHATGICHHHPATSSNIQAPGPRQAGKSSGEAEARRQESCPALGQPRLLLSPASLSPCGTKSGGRGSWQHGVGDRVGTAQGQWHPVWFLGRLGETPA